MAVHHYVKRARFRVLHQEGCFILPGRDVGSAEKLEKHRFKALATTGLAYAWSLLREDGQWFWVQTLDQLRMHCAVADLPVKTDFATGIASWHVGTFAARKGTAGCLGAMLAGTLPIYGFVFGTAWLAGCVPANQLLTVGVLPFLAGDLVKIGAVAAIGMVLPASLVLFLSEVS